MLPSHSATISVLEVLAKTQAFFSIDPDLMQEIKRWIQLRQEDDGSFTPLPADIKIYDDLYTKFFNVTTPKRIYFENCVEMTAETLIVLQEIAIDNDVSSKTKNEILKKIQIYYSVILKHYAKPNHI